MTRTLVGVDIGSAGVRAAELSVGKRRTTLRKFASVDLPPGAVTAGRVTDSDAVTDALGRLWDEGGFSTKVVTLGVANDSVLVRRMDLDWMPRRDFVKALHYQVGDALPVPVDEANLDYYLMEKVATHAGTDGEAAGESPGDVRQVARVMLVAAGREMVDTIVHAVQRAGLRPERVDLVAFALARAAHVAAEGEAVLEAVVDVGADTVTIVVHDTGRPLSVRTITGLGGEAITRALQERYQWEREDAERTKIVLGLPSPDIDHPAQRVIAASADELVTEIRATLAYFRGSRAEGHALQRVRVTGNGATLTGLLDLLAERLGVPVAPLVLLGGAVRAGRGLRFEDDDEPPVAVAGGLCLGGAS